VVGAVDVYLGLRYTEYIESPQGFFIIPRGEQSSEREEEKKFIFI